MKVRFIINKITHFSQLLIHNFTFFYTADITATSYANDGHHSEGIGPQKPKLHILISIISDDEQSNLDRHSSDSSIAQQYPSSP